MSNNTRYFEGADCSIWIKQMISIYGDAYADLIYPEDTYDEDKDVYPIDDNILML